MKNWLGNALAKCITPVVNDCGEIGVCIFGFHFFIYKDGALYYNGYYDSGTPMKARRVCSHEVPGTLRVAGHHKSDNEPNYHVGEGWYPIAR